MFNQSNVPKLYKKMAELGYFNIKSGKYLWLSEMEWMEPYKYEYDENESRNILPFAFSGRYDKWVFVDNGTDEPYIGLCCVAETNGIYFAKNFEDAILRNIIEFVSSADFYVEAEKAKSWQKSENELKEILGNYYKALKGLLKEEYLEFIKQLFELKLKKMIDQYGEWYVLLDDQEEEAVINQYINFPLMDDEFEWYMDDEKF